MMIGKHHRPHLAEESVAKMKTIQKSKLIVFLKGEPGAPRPFVLVGPPGAMVQMHSIDNLNIVCRSNERYRIKIFVKPHINPQKPEPPSAKGSSLVSYFPFLFITFSKTIYVKPQIRPKPPVQKFHLDLFIYLFLWLFISCLSRQTFAMTYQIPSIWRIINWRELPALLSTENEQI